MSFLPRRSFALYLEDTKTSIDRIKGYADGLAFDDFTKDQRTIDAVVRNLEIIGEAARHIPDEVKAKYPGIPWRNIVGMRDKISHEYFGVDAEILWRTIGEDLPQFRRQIEDIAADR